MGCNLFKIIMEASHMTRYKIEGHLKPKNLYEGSVEGQLKASKDLEKTGSWNNVFQWFSE